MGGEVADQLRPLRINAIELLRQPGALRDVTATITADALDIEHEALAGPIHVDLELEATNDGIGVTGSVSASWTGECRRCLTPLDGTASATVDERYQRTVTDDDAFPIENGQLDLAPMTRQVVLLELDDERVCRDDCAGLCPVCGIDRNVLTCDCDTSVKDDRWAALDGLVLDD